MDRGLSYWPAFVLTLADRLRRRRRGRARAHPPGREPSRDRDRDRDDRDADRPQRAHRLDLGRGGKSFDSPFPNSTVDVGGVIISIQDIGTFCVCLGDGRSCSGCSSGFTTLGLAMRAVAINPDASRLVGVRVGWMLALGWGFAAVLGAIAGMMAAPTVFLDPNMMLVILIYAFAAAVLGGIDSPSARSSAGCPRRRREPARRVCRLHRRGAAAADRARRPARSSSSSGRRACSGACGAAGYDAPRCATLRSESLLVARSRCVVLRSCRGSSASSASAQFTLRRDLLHRAARPEHPDRLQRPDLARPRRVHGRSARTQQRR